MLLRFVSSPLLYLRTAFCFRGKIRRFLPPVLSGAIDRKIGKESRQFSVDIFILVAVALGQEVFLSRFKRGLEGFGFWPCFGGPVGFV